jgi:hypothetical protein
MVIKSFVDHLGLDSKPGDVFHACLDVGTLILGDVGDGESFHCEFESSALQNGMARCANVVSGSQGAPISELNANSLSIQKADPSATVGKGNS